MVALCCLILSSTDPEKHGPKLTRRRGAQFITEFFIDVTGLINPKEADIRKYVREVPWRWAPRRQNYEFFDISTDNSSGRTVLPKGMPTRDDIAQH